MKQSSLLPAKPATRRAGVLHANAQWIGDRRRATKGEPPCPYLRLGFHLPEEVRCATLQWAALGVADFHLNGKKVGDGFLMPGWSDFRHRAQVISIDVTAMLRAGDNTLGAILGDGWYSGTLLFNNERNHYGTHPRLLARLDIELCDGRKLSVTTGRGWEVRYGPVLFSDIYHGESYDARRDLGDWCVPGASKAGWRAADVFPKYRGELVPKVNEAVRVTETLKPRKITEPQPGKYVFDFGQNLAGVCRLNVRGRRGQKITLKFAEMLNADGTVYRDNLRLARATDTYTCRGGGTEEWTPRFTFHGFRYVEVTGLDRKPSTGLLTALVLHGHVCPTGKFYARNPTAHPPRPQYPLGFARQLPRCADRLSAARRASRLTGDASRFRRYGGASLGDVRKFFRKWLQDLARYTVPTAVYPDIAIRRSRKHSPSNFGNAAWADLQGYLS